MSRNFYDLSRNSQEFLACQYWAEFRGGLETGPVISSLDELAITLGRLLEPETSSPALVFVTVWNRQLRRIADWGKVYTCCNNLTRQKLVEDMKRVGPLATEWTLVSV